MSETDQLCELISMLADQPGGGEVLLAPHIGVEALATVAQDRAWMLMRSTLSGANNLSIEAMHHMLAATFMEGFTIGCAWTRMKQGSGEK